MTPSGVWLRQPWRQVGANAADKRLIQGQRSVTGPFEASHNLPALLQAAATQYMNLSIWIWLQLQDKIRDGTIISNVIFF